MRLIDAESLKDRVSEYAISDDEYERFCKIINAEQTAYDVEKVVEQLEEERKYSYSDFDDYVSEIAPDLDREYDDFFYRGIERAVKIVKAGAVDE